MSKWPEVDKAAEQYSDFDPTEFAVSYRRNNKKYTEDRPERLDNLYTVYGLAKVDTKAMETIVKRLKKETRKFSGLTCTFYNEIPPTAAIIARFARRAAAYAEQFAADMDTAEKDLDSELRRAHPDAFKNSED